MNELALFAGAGGGILGGHLLGWRTVCAVERDAYAAAILAQRQNDGLLKAFPIWSDITTFDGRRWRGFVDVVSGGFPCQDISAAGKGAGIDGARSGMWSHMARIINEVRPKFAYMENSPMLTSRGLGRVLGDLAALGYDAEWGVVSCKDAGGVHLRERIWIIAADSSILQRNVCTEKRYLGSPEYRGAKMSEGLRTCETDPIYLNPLFAELTMMWPLGWTDLKPLETAKFQEWQQQHLPYCGNV
jgi:DNA (cytosine-5)-methyltransferase 1